MESVIEAVIYTDMVELNYYSYLQKVARYSCCMHCWYDKLLQLTCVLLGYWKESSGSNLGLVS